MNKTILLTILILFAAKGWAQDFPSRVWHEGRLVTADKDTLRGELKYNLEANTLQLRLSQKILKTFTSKKVFFFEIYDKGVNNFRQFYSIPYQVSQSYKTPIFFEVLYEGALTLMVRERIVIERDPYAPSFNGGRSASREQLAFTYYFVNLKGEIREYGSGKKSDLYEILFRNSEKVKKFIKDNKLRTDRMKDLVRITAFYNSI